MLTGEAELAGALARDWRVAALSEQDGAMLAYAVKLTRSPAAIGEADVEALRGVGFDDAAILDVCQVVAYYNYVNRLADGLGVELEDFWTDDELTITAAEWHERTHGAPGHGTTHPSEG
jgi:uncharacterized peroxidase-related enzyme